jgi:hypothetical protein
MPGTVKQFVDFSNNTNNDTGENTATSVQPIVNGETVDETVLQRPSESLRQRSEALRNIETDNLYLRDADRSLVLAGPGKITWAGSTTVAADGIPVVSDVLYLLPMLTPGYAQTAPVPPVASAYGTLHLKRASDSMDSIAVTSMRRSYAAGDQINIEVTAGGSFSCTLLTSSGYQRTIQIVATGSTDLTATINALNALLPSAPDNTQLVSAALEGGALGTDLLLTTQAKQYVTGNYDGEGHTITPANLASFFVSNPTSALAEGDTLCVQYDMVADTASTDGRRQALPENSNTAIPAAAFFNSRINPEKLVNALPICKVVNGRLTFGTGCELPAGSVAADLAGSAADISYGGGGNWADGTTNPATTVEVQLDKIITDLAGATGTGKVQGSAVGSELAAGTLAAQISAIVARTLGWTTIGNGTTIIGDFNTNAYADANALLTAAVAALPTNGGRILLKRGVTLSGFNSTTVTMPAGKTVEIIGDWNATPVSTPQITFTTGESLTCSATGTLILRNLSIRQAAPAGGAIVLLTTAPCQVFDCYIENTGTTDNANDNGMFQGSNVTDLTMERIHYNTTAIPNSVLQARGLLNITGTAYRVSLKQIRGSNTGGDGTGLIRIVDMRNNVVLEDIVWQQSGSIGATGVVLGSTDNTASESLNRKVLRYSAAGEYGLDPGGAGYLTVTAMDARGCTASAIGSGTPWGPGLAFVQCLFGPQDSQNMVMTDVRFDACTFSGINTSFGSSGVGAHGQIVFSKCEFAGQDLATVVVQGSSIVHVSVEDCYFHDHGNTTAADFGLFKVKATTLNQAVFKGNRIVGFQNGVYAGGDSTNHPRIFEVDADTLDGLVVDDNVVRDVMMAVTGNTRKAAYLIDVSSTDRTATSTSWGSIYIRDNTVGDQPGYCQLGHLSHGVVINDLRVTGNAVNCFWHSATTHATLEYFFHVEGHGGVGIIMLMFTFDNNAVYVSNLTSDTIGGGAGAVLRALGGGSSIQNFSFSHNYMFHDTTTALWSIGLSMTGWSGGITNVMFLGNSAVRNTSSATDHFNIEFGGVTVITRSLPTGWPFGAGVEWPDNLMMTSNE